MVGASVKFICSNAAGYDAIDIHAAAKRGIYVSNTPGAVDSVSYIKQLLEGSLIASED
jgi:lactate dehydrogenase-like 2-hydroxyacid dehydrogenase